MVKSPVSVAGAHGFAPSSHRSPLFLFPHTSNAHGLASPDQLVHYEYSELTASCTVTTAYRWVAGLLHSVNLSPENLGQKDCAPRG